MTTPATAFKIKANDRKPAIAATLGFEGTATPVDLTQATVTFILRAKDKATGLPKASAEAKVNAAAVVVDGAAGKVRYDWAVGDTSVPGEYLAEWEVTDVDGLTQTFPTDAYNDVLIYADLDGAP